MLLRCYGCDVLGRFEADFLTTDTPSLGTKSFGGRGHYPGEPTAPRSRPRTVPFWQDPRVKADDLFPRNLRGKLRELWRQYRPKLSRGQVPP